MPTPLMTDPREAFERSLMPVQDEVDALVVDLAMPERADVVQYRGDELLELMRGAEPMLVLLQVKMPRASLRALEAGRDAALRVLSDAAAVQALGEHAMLLRVRDARWRVQPIEHLHVAVDAAEAAGESSPFAAIASHALDAASIRAAV